MLIFSDFPLASFAFSWFAFSWFTFYRNTSCVDGNTNIILLQPSLKINRGQTRKHNRVIYFVGFIQHALILRSRLTFFFFSASPCHKKKLDEGICPFPIVASKNNAFIRHFLSCNLSKDCSKQESDQWIGVTFGLVLKKRASYDH